MIEDEQSAWMNVWHLFYYIFFFKEAYFEKRRKPAKSHNNKIKINFEF